MEIIQLENDIPVLCIAARSFPEGIMAAHEELHTLLPYATGREYYGISWRDGCSPAYQELSDGRSLPVLPFYKVHSGSQVANIKALIIR